MQEYNIIYARICLYQGIIDYEDYTKNWSDYNGISALVGQAIPGTGVFSRTNKVFGIGLDYKF